MCIRDSYTPFPSSHPPFSLSALASSFPRSLAPLVFRMPLTLAAAGGRQGRDARRAAGLGHPGHHPDARGERLHVDNQPHPGQRRALQALAPV
eukprot:334592-Rhodomonas_salina.2